MITLIEKLFGSTLGKWIAEALVVLIAVVALVYHFEHKGAAEELGKLQKSSATLITKANAQIAANTKQYQAAQAANQEKTNAALAANTTLQSQLTDSVRQYDAYRRAHSAVASTTGASGAAQPGECGPEDCGSVIARLAVRGNELAGSVGALSADLQSCQRDRDALTGLPK